MRRSFIFILCLLIIFACALPVYAAATKARVGSLDKGIEQVVGIGDLSSGDTLEVDSYGRGAFGLFCQDYQALIDSNGNLAVELKNNGAALTDADNALVTKGYPSKYGVFNNADTQIKSGACTVYGITVTGTSAGDYVLIYDNPSAAGVPEFDIKVGTAADTKVLPFPEGITFSRGIYVDCKDTFQVGTVIYDD